MNANFDTWSPMFGKRCMINLEYPPLNFDTTCDIPCKSWIQKLEQTGNMYTLRFKIAGERLYNVFGSKGSNLCWEAKFWKNSLKLRIFSFFQNPWGFNTTSDILELSTKLVHIKEYKMQYRLESACVLCQTDNPAPRPAKKDRFEFEKFLR